MRDRGRPLRLAATSLAAGALLLGGAQAASAAVVVQRGSDNAIGLLTGDPAEPLRVVAYGRCPVLTPDGQTVVFHGPADDSLLAVPAAGGETRLLAPGAVATASCSRQAVVSPDGAAVAAQTKNRKVLVVRLADGVLTRLSATTVSQLAVAPGGASVVVDRNVRGGGIDLFSVRNRSKLSRTALTKDHVSFSPTWAGSRVVYSRIQGGRSTLRSLSPKSRSSKLLLRRPKGWLASALGVGPSNATILATTQRFKEKGDDLVTTGPVRVGVIRKAGAKVAWRLLSPGEQLLGGVDAGAAALSITEAGEVVRTDLATGARTVLATGAVSAGGV